MMPGLAPATSARLSAGEEIFLITGAGGWLGRALVEMIASTLGQDVADRVVLCGSSNRSLQLSDGQLLPIHALDEGISLLGDRPAYVCHFAFLTKDRVGQMSDREYVDRNRELADTVLGAVAGRNVRGVLLSSSGAVYDHLEASERDGAANLYGMLKAEDERRFAQLCESRGVPLVVPRIFNVSGPFINKFSAYALSSIIVDVLSGGPVRLRAARPVYRSYVHVADILELTLRALFDAADQAAGEVLLFDTRGDETLEVGELASRICLVLGRDGMPIVRPELTDTAADCYVGAAAALAELLHKQRYELIGLDRQIADTAAYIRKILEAA